MSNQNIVLDCTANHAVASLNNQELAVLPASLLKLLVRDNKWAHVSQQTIIGNLRDELTDLQYAEHGIEKAMTACADFIHMRMLATAAETDNWDAFKVKQESVLPADKDISDVILQEFDPGAGL